MAGVNTKILASDFNQVQSLIGSVMGTGSGQSGYGQAYLSSQVTTSTHVSINEYAALRYDIINAYKHLYNTTPSNVDEQVEGGTIRYDAANAPISYWTSIATTIYNNRRNLAVAGQRGTRNFGTEQQTWPGSLGDNWSNSLYCIVTCTWTTSEQARYFFNAGGSIEFTSSRTGGSASAQNTSWTSMLSTAGSRQFAGNYPGSDTEPNDGANYFRLSNVRQVWSTVTASSPYSLNDWTIYARTLDGVIDNSTGSSRSIEFYVVWNDDHAALGGAGGFGPDAVDGTLSLTVQGTYATGVLEPAGFGNFTVEIPTVSIGSITIA